MSRNAVVPSNGEISPLYEGEVHVWRTSLDDADQEEFRPHLASDELQRAARFHFERDRKRFVAARGLLRSLLATYSGCAPHEIEFRYGPEGKPSSPSLKIEFNVSHSEGLAIIGFSKSCALGVDVEVHRRDFELQELSEQNFSAREQEVFRCVPNEQRVEAFFNCWTRKEAFLKAVGGGLSVPLQLFDVDFEIGKPAGLSGVRGRLSKLHDWSIINLPLDPGVSAALASPRRDLAVKLWSWARPAKKVH